jgi:hypothetical protein
MLITDLLSRRHCSEQYLMPKHSLQTSGGTFVSLNALSQIAQSFCCSVDRRPLSLHDCLCDMLWYPSIREVLAMNEGNAQFGGLAFVAAARHRLAQLTHDVVAVFRTD